MFQHEISASWDTLLQQASMTSNDFLAAALRATENLPEGVDRTAIIVAHMRASCSDWQAVCFGVGVQKLCFAIEEASRNLGQHE